MRFLHQPSRFHLRLGWLDVLVRLVGPAARDLPRVAEALLALPDSFEDWIESAALSALPHGALAPGSAKELARMVVSYGLYDERTAALTDAGNVLLATPRETTSPFLWRWARRWVGLWLLMRADGDVTLSILREWPDEPLAADAVDAHLAGRLRDLAGRAGDDAERSDLLGQADRVVGVSTGRRNVVAPRMEPLRELGYLVRLPEINGYALTEVGRRLRDVWRGEFGSLDGDALLRAGLSRSFFSAEGVDDAAPATFDALVEGIEGAPEPLLVTKGESPLTPLVAWIQWSLLDRGRRVWIDDALALTLARGVRTDRRGSFDLKRDEHVDGVNLAWAPRHDVAEGHALPALLPEAPPEAAATPPHPSPPPESPPDPITFQIGHPEEIPALLWLQYVQERTRAFEAGDPDALRRGGVETRLRQLRALLALPAKHLENKRKPTPGSPSKDGLPAVRCLQRHGAVVVPAGFHLAALASEWGAPDLSDHGCVGARVEASQVEARRRADEALKEIRAFLTIEMAIPLEPKQILDVFNQRWRAVQECTRSVLADLVANGSWTLDTLTEYLHAAVSSAPSPRQASLALLDVLEAPSRRFEYWQVRWVPSRWGGAVDLAAAFKAAGVAFAELDGVDGNVRLGVTGIVASSRSHARRLGASRCDDAIAEVMSRARLFEPLGQVEKQEAAEETESEDGAPASPLAPPISLDWAGLFDRPRPPAPRLGEGPLGDAQRGLARLRFAERRPGEALLTMWTIVEDLAKGGRDLHSYEVIANASRALAVAVLRLFLLATHDRAVGALVALAHLNPEHPGLDDRISHWCRSWNDGRARVRAQTEPLRRSTLLARGERVTANSERDALLALWDGARRPDAPKSRSKPPKGEGSATLTEGEPSTTRSDAPKCEGEALQRAITALSPLAARRLADVWEMLDVGADGKLRNAHGLAGIARTLIGDAQAFWSEVYDARNRIVHQGELARLHERDAPIRLDALVPTLAAVVELLIDELSAAGTSDLPSGWARLSLRAVDLSDERRLEGMTCEGFIALVGIAQAG